MLDAIYAGHTYSIMNIAILFKSPISLVYLRKNEKNCKYEQLFSEFKLLNFLMHIKSTNTKNF